MKHSLLAAALLGAFAAGTVHAQTSVQIYGTIDAGVIKRSGESLNIGKRASNTLGFKGTEELGNGLKALFQLEMRYEPDALAGIGAVGNAMLRSPLQVRSGLVPARPNDHSHFETMRGLISPGSAKITSARSPIIPAPTKAGAFLSGPSPLVSVLIRRLRSQNLCSCPFAIVTV